MKNKNYLFLLVIFVSIVSCNTGRIRYVNSGRSFKKESPKQVNKQEYLEVALSPESEERSTEAEMASIDNSIHVAVEKKSNSSSQFEWKSEKTRSTSEMIVKTTKKSKKYNMSPVVDDETSETKDMRKYEILARLGGALFFILTAILAFSVTSGSSLGLAIGLVVLILVALIVSLAGLAQKNQLLLQEPEYAKDDVSQEHTIGFMFLGLGATLLVLAALTINTISFGLPLGILFWTFPLWLIPAGITLLNRRTFEEYKLLQEKRAKRAESRENESVAKKKTRAGITIGVILVLLLVLIIFV